MSEHPLEPAKFVKNIKQQEVYLSERSKEDPSDSENERQTRRQRAINLGAVAAAEAVEREKGESNIDSRLSRLVSLQSDFFDSQKQLNNYRRYDKRDMSPEMLDNMDADKQKITEFNHSLREVIEASADKFSFNDLMVFMTNMHVGMRGLESREEFYNMSREAMIGMRNEVAVEQILISYGDFSVETGTVEDDARGGDFIIDGAPIDVKASYNSAQRAQEKSINHGYDPSGIVWSQIEFEDFEGNLLLPDDRAYEISHHLIPAVDQAVASSQQRQVVGAA